VPDGGPRHDRNPACSACTAWNTGAPTAGSGNRILRYVTGQRGPDVRCLRADLRQMVTIGRFSTAPKCRRLFVQI
jgi:hypothetical protein